ncbi:MAG: hypothetical protein ACI4EG_03455 [Fusicatenibacter sp.]|nr:hypothetical protein [Fusicatenibacter sp.]
MSKFLKIIVNVMLLLGIISAGALVIPPLMGVTTVISDGTGSTNLTRGSVTYAKNESAGELSVGDQVLVDNSKGEFVYEIQGVNEDGTTFLVQDKVSGETSDQTYQGKVSKVILTVPVIGYMSMAAQSKEGMLIIILAIVFVVILFILSEVWKEDEDDEEDEEADREEEDSWDTTEDPDEEEEDTVTQMLTEEFERSEGENTEEETAEDTAKDEEMEAFTVKGLEEEPVEEVLIDTANLAGMIEEEFQMEEKSPVAISETMPDTEKETPQDKEDSVTEEKDPMEEALAASLEAALNTPVRESSGEPQITGWMEEPEEEAPAENVQEEEVIELAIPIYTAEELLEKAHAAGDDPKVIEDPKSGVTILDYSDII